MKLNLHVGGVALAGMCLYDLLRHARIEDLDPIVEELEEYAFQLRRRIRACGRSRWPHGATETWPLAEAIRLRAQLEAIEHVLVVIGQRRNGQGCEASLPAATGALSDLRSVNDLDVACECSATLGARDI